MSASEWSPGYQSITAVKLALKFATIAAEDVDTAKILHRRRKYASAVYHFQQAVEKDTKAIGLLIGTIQPTSTDLLKVRHASPLGLLLRMPDMLQIVPPLQARIRQALDTPEIKKLGILELFDPILKAPNASVEDTRNAIRAISRVSSADASRAWRVTLELNPNHPGTKNLMSHLKQADKKYDEVDEAEIFFEVHLGKYRKFLRDPWFMDYIMNIQRAVPELTPLGYISMWHEKETRYPAIGGSDYWDHEAYTKDSGIVKNFPLLHRHLRRLSQSTLFAAQAALQSVEHGPTKDGSSSAQR